MSTTVPADPAQLVAAVLGHPGVSAKFQAYLPQQHSFAIFPDAAETLRYDPQGFALPPDHLYWGYRTAEWFLKWGQEDVERMNQITAASGFPLEQAQRILDFGCGPGRMIRWLKPLADQSREIWGADMVAECMLYCRRHLSPPFWFTTATSFPHLPFEDRYFDFVYAMSVFTHITDLADAWLLELKRIVRPGGRLYLTICDNHTVDMFLEDPTKNQFVADLLLEFVKDTPLSGRAFEMVSLNRMPGPGHPGEAQVFYHIDYIRKHWGRLFKILSINEEAFGGVQTGVLLERLP